MSDFTLVVITHNYLYNFLPRNQISLTKKNHESIMNLNNISFPITFVFNNINLNIT